MVKIGVISDTHLSDPREGFRLMERLAKSQLSGVDMVLHAGDIVDPLILDAFAGIPIFAVQGNMDPPTLELPMKRLVQVGSIRIGLIHGWGAKRNLEQRIAGAFYEDMPDCLVYGHSHMPVCHKRDGVLFFNPGSPTEKREAPYPSVGILNISGKEVSGEIIRLEQD